MSGDKCVFYNCTNTRRNSKHIFHNFPTDKELLNKWIINSGKFLISIILIINWYYLNSIQSMIVHIMISEKQK